jgi:hypothetical protein
MKIQRPHVKTAGAVYNPYSCLQYPVFHSVSDSVTGRLPYIRRIDKGAACQGIPYTLPEVCRIWRHGSPGPIGWQMYDIRGFPKTSACGKASLKSGFPVPEQSGDRHPRIITAGRDLEPFYGNGFCRVPRPAADSHQPGFGTGSFIFTGLLREHFPFGPNSRGPGLLLSSSPPFRNIP